MLDYANRDMAGIEFMKNLPKDIESPEKNVGRIKKVLAVVPPERVCLSSDCGMKPLARMVAKMKLKALADAAKIVRKQLGVK